MFVKHHIEETYLYFVAAGFNIAIIVVDRSAKDPPRQTRRFQALVGRCDSDLRILAHAAWFLHFRISGVARGWQPI